LVSESVSDATSRNTIVRRSRQTGYYRRSRTRPGSIARLGLLMIFSSGPFILGACGKGNPPAPTAEQIQALAAEGERAAAIAAARDHVTEDPADPRRRLVLAETYIELGDGAAAHTAFERAAELGADPEAVHDGKLESLMLQGDYAGAIALISGENDRSNIGDQRLTRRLEARLRVPLAEPRELFLDARELLRRNDVAGMTALERLVSSQGVLADNAGHVRRAVAYWSCQQPDAATTREPALYVPPWANTDQAGRRILRVGPDEELKAPSDAARIAGDGDIVEIAAGTYTRDVAVWTASDLWIRAVGGKVVLDSRGRTAGDQGIWVIRGDNTLLEGIRFTGARSPERNGSGIRLLARNLWVRNSEFHDNETGLLSYNEPGGEVLVEQSLFTDNGAGDGYSHNIYVGRADRFIFRFNYSAGVWIGHQVKSRALDNFILYNRLADEDEGRSSYTIDLPEGGFALVLGNELQQGPYTVNKHMVSLGAEVPAGREHRFIFAHNTFYNNTSPATFIRDATGAGVSLVNNLFAGASANLAVKNNLRTGNIFDGAPYLRAPRERDYRLRATAAIIDMGETLDTVDGTSITPQYEYVHPAGAEPRHTAWRPDPGAHEFCGWPEMETTR